MGADANIYIFDYELYRSRVVPAFQRFLREGSIDEWVLELRREDRVTWGLNPDDLSGATLAGSIDLPRCCTYLDDEFAVRNPVAPRDLCECGWDIRACSSADCSVRAQCPFHVGGACSVDSVEELLFLFKRSVVRRCLGAGQFLGRSIDCFYYWETLDQLGVSLTDPIRILLERLGRRGFVVGYRWSAGTEGIHGWLTPAETKTLAERLFALSLPEYECSFVAMEQFKTTRDIVYGRVPGAQFLWPVYEHPTVPFKQLSLSYVRTVCTIAMRDGKGVLWGNDIG